MDEILNLDDDSSNLLSLPNLFCADDILKDFDSLEFENDFEDDLIFDYDIDKNLSNPEYCRTFNDSFYVQEKIVNHVDNNLNGKSNGLNIRYELSEKSGKNLLTINDLLDSNSYTQPNEMIKLLQDNDKTNFNKPVVNVLIPSGNSKINNPKSIPSKHPIILPAKNISTSNLLRSPTLAATLISMQPTKSETNFLENNGGNISNNNGKRVVRRNSHNAIEKRYRLSINDKIDELRHMLFLTDDSKMNKSNVLKKAIERIKSLEDENNALKCENYNLRISRNLPLVTNKNNNGNNSVESLNRTSGSPSSNNSDSGQSIETNPSSSSMHSSSVISGSLFMKSKEDSLEKAFIPSTRGLKRPLINNYGGNKDNLVNKSKNEKLARLLLDKDNCVDKQSYPARVKENRNSSTKLHSSNLPGFLLCTLALFCVSFQPFDVLFKYQSKSSTVTGGRQLLQYSNAEEKTNTGFVFALCLTLTHWCVAFCLIWGSTYNRFIFKKSFSKFLLKIESLLTHLVFKNVHHPSHDINYLNNILNECSHDRKVYQTKLDSLIEEYGCSYKINPIKRIFYFNVCLIVILINFIRIGSQNKHPLNDFQKARIYLLTVVMDRSFVDRFTYSKLELLWYKFLLFSLTWNAEDSNDLVFTKFVLALSINTKPIRTWVLNKVIKSAFIYNNNSDSDNDLLFLMNHEAQKMLMKTDLRKLKDKFHGCSLNKPINPKIESLVSCYFIVYAEETMESAAQMILGGQSEDSTVVDKLKEIVYFSSSLLNKNDCNYFSLWCHLMIVILESQDDRYLNGVLKKLINHYLLLPKRMTDIDSSSDIVATTTSLKLLLSTIRLCGKETDNVYHDLNLIYLHDLFKYPNLDTTCHMLLKLSFNRIIQALVTYHSMSPTFLSSIIYYANNYSKQLSIKNVQHSKIEKEMVNQFEIFLQNLCQLNPLKQITALNCNAASIKKENAFIYNCKAMNDFAFRISDFLSLERDFKLRSH